MLLKLQLQLSVDFKLLVVSNSTSINSSNVAFYNPLSPEKWEMEWHGDSLTGSCAHHMVNQEGISAQSSRG